MSEITIKRPMQKLRQLNKAGGVTSGTLALAISGALVSGTANAQDDEIALEKVKVEESVTPDTNPYAVPGAPYYADTLSDPRRTRPISETPQTITVLTETEIKDTGRSDLREILDAQPGITLGTGENGNAFGDRYIIRGHEARSDVFVDGLRDPGMTIRESFATEQVEISKGPSASFAGRGTTGGAVNSATKRASTEYDFNKVTGGIGTDSLYRLTFDGNKVINYDTAVRLNLLHAAEDVPDRSPAERERKGAAISLTHQPTDKLEITGDYYHFQGDDKPDLGSYVDFNTNEVYEGIPVYLQGEDFLESQVDTATLRIGYEFTPKSRIVNLTRYGTTDNGYLMTGARGTTAYRDIEEVTDDEGNTTTTGIDEFSSIGLSTHQGWQEVEYFANQLNLITNQEIAGMNHELVFSLEYSDQNVLNGVYDYTVEGASNCYTAGRGGVGQGYCMIDADGNTITNLNSLLQRDVSRGDWDSDWNVKTTGISAMDVVDVTDKLTVFGGLRYDYYDYETLAFGRGAEEATTYENSDGLINGHLGASYKVTPEGNVYASFSTASNLNGGESDLGTSCGYGGICVDQSNPGDLGDPEKTQSIELGTKWHLNEGKLLATAAVFQITKDDVFESASDDSYNLLGNLNTGKNRVKGIELGIAGNLNDKLSVQAGVAIMEADVLESVNPENKGKTLANFAEQSLSLHARYQATSKFAFGGTATYESERFVGQPDSAANEDLGVPDYTVFDAFASYKVNRDFLVRLNVGNVFDEDYYQAAYRSGSFAYIGDRRNAQLTVEYNF